MSWFVYTMLPHKLADDANTCDCMSKQMLTHHITVKAHSYHVCEITLLTHNNNNHDSSRRPLP